ncbi:hypothetical protein AB4144_51005, partial [Rhizobiaceae sp. 2RAB30]
MTYLRDSALAVEIEPSLLCSILLDGKSEPMDIAGETPIGHTPERVEVLGFGSRVACSRPWFAGQRSRAFGITVKPAFLDRFADSVADGGFAPLRNFLEPGFRRATLPWMPRALEIANDVLCHPYGGSLARLYHESHSLRFLLEIAVA